jgi:hypothetical protein
METIITTSRREDPFSRVPKDILNDSSISWKAKGVLAYLIGKPKGWKTRVSDLVRHGPDGESSIRSALMELRKAGYADLVQLRKGNKIREWVWKISDSKIFTMIPKKHRVEAYPSLDCGFQHVGFQDLENRHSNKKEENKKEPTKNDEQMGEEERISYDSSKVFENMRKKMCEGNEVPIEEEDSYEEDEY